MIHTNNDINGHEERKDIRRRILNLNNDIKQRGTKMGKQEKQMQNVLVLRASRTINEVHSFEMNRIECIYRRRKQKSDPNVPCQRGIRHSDKIYPIK